MRYYVGHKGKFGHEFLEFEFRPNGRLRYANNSNYKADSQIRKEVYVNDIILEELKRIITDSKILQVDSKDWPEPNQVGKQELQVFINGKMAHFKTCKFGSFADIQNSADPLGIPIFHYLLQDIKCMVFSIINMHFRVRPMQ